MRMSFQIIPESKLGKLGEGLRSLTCFISALAVVCTAVNFFDLLRRRLIGVEE